MLYHETRWVLRAVAREALEVRDFPPFRLMAHVR